jgi:hypothetical protein
VAERNCVVLWKDEHSELFVELDAEQQSDRQRDPEPVIGPEDGTPVVALDGSGI